MYKDLVDTIGFVTEYDPEVGNAMNDELKRVIRASVTMVAASM